ncbi:MAG TPA: ATP-dependent helicase C-terminal domain-containing protein, partial [Terriglobales bacterium]|nr:ATP-dependent helicase C-terminal domain-containing protein [Terriglobales bacterium]
AERVAAHTGAQLLRSQGRQYPVEIEYFPAQSLRRLDDRVAAAVRHALNGGDDGGDILVFLPGASEIRRAAQALADQADCFEVLALHGDLPLAEQYQAIQPGRRRKLILSTNIAETALTVEGVTVVIDSGLARVARFDSKHGINSLTLARISRASADQRAGRAGRVRPGRCLRLWSIADQQGRMHHDPPEIGRLDLSEMLLELKAWGLARPQSLPWLDAAPEAAWLRADRLLRRLGALAEPGDEVSEIGRRMLRLSLSPRLARMLIEAERRNCGDAAALVAALASERDIRSRASAFPGQPAPTSTTAQRSSSASGVSDLLVRRELFEQVEREHFSAHACRALALDAGAVRNVERTRRQLMRALRGGAGGGAREEDLLRCVLAGFPDRVVRRRAPGSRRGVMVGGKGVALAPASVVREAELFVAIEIESSEAAGEPEAQVRVASAIERAWLDEMFADAVESGREAIFDWQRQAVIERQQTRFHDLVLEETVRGCADPVAATRAIAAAVRENPAAAFDVSPAAQSLLERLAAARRWLPELDLPEPGTLLADAAAGLCQGHRRFAELKRLDLLPALQAQLGAQWRLLERELPSHYPLPNGRSAAVRYHRDRPPVVSARIQELFGLGESPRLARGRVALAFELLSPSQRPVQITDDLASFWRGTYTEVRKQLRGRYPKHAWPEDPWTAPPVRRHRR